jgi:hypothetical protein
MLEKNWNPRECFGSCFLTLKCVYCVQIKRKRKKTKKEGKMKTNSIFARKTSEIMSKIDDSGAKAVYAVAAALYYIGCRRKTERSIDKLVISCYNTKNERMFLLETRMSKETRDARDTRSAEGDK